MNAKDLAYWLADKISALGDYVKQAASVLRWQADELERLRAELRDVTLAVNDDRTNNTMTLAEVVAALRAEVEALRKDAERYRWLRDKAPEKWAVWADERDQDNCDSDEIDAAIDKAMQEQQP